MKVDFESLPILLQKARESVVLTARKTLAGFDLTEQQWRVIRTTYLNGELNAQTLASQSAILGPSLSRILNRLEEEGFLLRKVSPGDQRELIISLSAKGKRLHQKVQPKVQANYDELSAKLSTKKISDLVGLLDDVIALEQ
ncbi:homoprotocatechuate degradation operon regulator HpaR [Marinagarivorans algicola]|uniref:homoprotocatechuate degradation operon regulator HpaR n=1 Tax=Marinagarivorans algicola TaxID=1513270 RepID=UPI0006B6507D|nr:homoprotocatechuate degradation operon regulator HpaR [Marinagarivorans algicola]